MSEKKGPVNYIKVIKDMYERVFTSLRTVVGNAKEIL